jgi:hypothetical protein
MARKKREPPISIRLSRAARDKVRRDLAESGVPRNAYINSAILNAPIPRRSRHPPVEKQMLAQLLYRSAAIRDALESATRDTPGDARAAENIAAIRTELEMIRAAVMRMMERAP